MKAADLTTQTPKQIDTVLAANWQQQNQVANSLQRAQEIAKQPTAYRSYAYQMAERIPQLEAQLTALQAEAKPYEAEYRRRPWHRYFLVTNAAGHVHRERTCSTCFPTTTYAWLVDLSGCDERAMVAEYGTDACTVCFPAAPVLARQLNVVSKTQREREAARTARETKRAATAAKKVEKAITNPDGTRLKGPMWTIETVAQAKQELVDAAGVISRVIPNLQWQADNRAAFDRIAVALAAKLGEDVEAIKTAALAKAAKRGY